MTGWTIGFRYKIISKGEEVWTATIVKVDGKLVWFDDLHGTRRAINEDDIKSIRLL